MASLVDKTTSDVFIQKANEQELVSGRTRTFKKFRLPDAPDGRKRYRIGGGVGPVHYKHDPYSKSEQYKEIDLDVVIAPSEDWYAACETNGYQVRFWQSRLIDGKTVRYIAQFRRADKWFTIAPLALYWQNKAGQRQLISKALSVDTPVIDNESNHITWSGVFGDGIDYRYNLRPDEFFKTVIINDKANLPAPTINTDGLRLVVSLASSWHGEIKASNNFATDITISDLADDDFDYEQSDEQIDNLDRFSYKDSLDRDIWWIQKPKAWDSFDVSQPLNHDCENCNKLCCKYSTNDYPRLYPKLDKEFIEKYPDLVIEKDGKLYAKRPCPLLVDNECTCEVTTPQTCFNNKHKCSPSCGEALKPQLKENEWENYWGSSRKKENHRLLTSMELLRSGSQVNILISVDGSFYNNKYIDYPVFIDTDISEEQVGASTDDCGDGASDLGDSWSTSNTQDRVGSFGSKFYNSYDNYGVRWQTVPIPQGATIDSAVFSPYIDDRDGSPATRLRGLDEDNISAFSTENAFNALGRTTDYVDVANDLSYDDFINITVTDLVQEIVNRDGWSSNNALGLEWDDNSSANGDNYLVATYDYSDNTYGAKFNCSYTEGGGETATIDESNSVSITEYALLLLNLYTISLYESITTIDEVIVHLTPYLLSEYDQTDVSDDSTVERVEADNLDIYVYDTDEEIGNVA